MWQAKARLRHVCVTACVCAETRCEGHLSIYLCVCVCVCVCAYVCVRWVCNSAHVLKCVRKCIKLCVTESIKMPRPCTCAIHVDVQRAVSVFLLNNFSVGVTYNVECTLIAKNITGHLPIHSGPSENTSGKAPVNVKLAVCNLRVNMPTV